MKMTRRQFLKTAAAAVAAPAIVKAENIMPIWVPPEPKIIEPSVALFQPSAGVETIGIYVSDFSQLRVVPEDMVDPLAGIDRRDLTERELNVLLKDIWEAGKPLPQTVTVNKREVFSVQRKPLGPRRSIDEVDELMKKVRFRILE